MKNVEIVIGLNYGDEGKGLATDFLASNYDPSTTAVARFNGGCQAAHTVETPSGQRHVFNTFSSGTFAGCPTILTGDFIFNPVMFWREAVAISEIDGCPSALHIFIDPECIVTTPYDMLINQELEKSRSNKRHGSCGVGINETMVRTECGYGIRVKDLLNGDWEDKLSQICNEYLPTRTGDLGLSPISEDTINTFFGKFAEDINSFYEVASDKESHIYISPDTVSLSYFENIIFEGAQGLRLDQNGRDFPHVTHSNTGLKNVVPFLTSDMTVTVNYITRTYLSRHGAGPLNNEISAEIVDKTNKPNNHQGAMRYANFDRIQYNRMTVESAIDRAIIDAHMTGYRINMFITHCDQYENIGVEPIEAVIEELCKANDATSYRLVSGPNRSNVGDLKLRSLK